MVELYGYSRSNRGAKGLDFQNQLIKKYSNSINLELEIYSDLNSGSIIGTQLQRLVSNIPRGSKIITTKRSRISRNSNDYQLVVNELRGKNVELIFLDELKE